MCELMTKSQIGSRSKEKALTLVGKGFSFFYRRADRQSNIINFDTRLKDRG